MPPSVYTTNSQIEPKRSFRGALYIAAPGQVWPKFLIKSFSRPGVQNAILPPIYLMPASRKPKNQIMHLRQDRSIIYKPLRIVMYEDGSSINKDTNTALSAYKVLSFLGYTDEFKNNAGSSGTQYQQFKNNFGVRWYIEELLPNGDSFARWTIINPRLAGVDFSDFDYDQEGLTTVSLDVQYEGFKYDHFKTAGTSANEAYSSAERTRDALMGGTAGDVNYTFGTTFDTRTVGAPTQVQVPHDSLAGHA